MHVQVKNGLAAVGICVKDDPITVIGESSVAGNFGRRQQKVAEQVPLGVCRLVERIDMRPRDDQNMRRGLWLEIVKGHAQTVLVYTFGRDRTVGDAAKYTVCPIFHSN